jgi:acyl dehydratase
MAGGAVMSVKAGLVLPELVIEVTPTFVVASAIATRDFQDVHHDRDRAVQRGSKDIFINILTTTGLVQRYVTSWAGPQALVRQIAIRLGVPCYAGDTLTFSGQVAESAASGIAASGIAASGIAASGIAGADGTGADGTGADGTGADGTGADGTGEYVVQVVGRCSLGDHVTGTVRIAGSTA